LGWIACLRLDLAWIDVKWIGIWHGLA
jgi:hypothetical protein